MSILQLIDRQLLGDIGITLNDDDYSMTIAGMGFTFITAEIPTNNVPDFIEWSPGKFCINLNNLKNCVTEPKLNSYSEIWRNNIPVSLKRRISIVGDENECDLDLVSIARILKHPAVQANSVFIKKPIKQADLRWQWPLRIGAFENDLEELKLESLANMWPAKNLSVLNSINREESRCEILMMHGNIRDSLRKILCMHHRVRTCHVVLIGPVDVTWRELSSHLDALLSETQAGAFSIISCPPASTPQIVNNLIEQLSHNISYDLALTTAFQPTTSIHLFDLRLLKAATLTTVARDIGKSLKAMPHKAMVSLKNENILKDANINWTSSKSVFELGEELEDKSYKNAIYFEHEGTGASALGEITTAARSKRLEVARSEVPRFLQGDLFKFIEGSPVLEQRGLIVGRKYRLDIYIGPGGEGTITAEIVVDEDNLDWKKKHSYTLQVVFTEPEQWDEPLTGKLVLPRQGTSTKCSFLFTPSKPGPFLGHVTVYFRGRILQTALLKISVFDSEGALAASGGIEPLKFSIESEIHRSLGTLDERRRFDACMVSNKISPGKRTIATCSENGAYIFDLSTVDKQLAAINSIMNDVANDQETYSKGLTSSENADLLYKLAREGNWIYRNLVCNFKYKSSAAGSLDNAEYLQIVSTHQDEPVPLEFVYDYPLPKPGAQVCKNAREALKKGLCPENCKNQASPADFVCPLGFWGLRKVIERHQIGSTLLDIANAEAVVINEPIGDRNTLSLNGPILVAASKEVPSGAQTVLKDAIQMIWKNKMIFVEKWNKWVNAVKNDKPVILLALPHNAGSGSYISLEISNDTLQSSYINESYVKADLKDNGPIVILFGCDTAGVADTSAYTNHITVFRQARAALVLGTVATVLGKSAATVSANIVKQLASITENSKQCFGEVLRQVKREAVADSQMVALCLVAFGDADWRLQ